MPSDNISGRIRLAQRAVTCKLAIDEVKYLLPGEIGVSHAIHDSCYVSLYLVNGKLDVIRIGE